MAHHRSWWQKALHYLDPRTAFAAQEHAAARLAHYADPRTQYKQLIEAAHFTERQARKDYVKGMRITDRIVKVVTPLLAFVGSIVSIAFGGILGPVLAYLGSLIARFSGEVDARSRGIHGLESRQFARRQAKETLQYGLGAAAVGGIAGGVATAAGLGADVAAAGAEAAAVPTAAEQVAGLAPVATVDPAFASAAPATPFISAAGAPQAAGPAVVIAGGGADTIATVSNAASSGILGTGITAEKLLGLAASVVPKVLSALGPKPQTGGPGAVGSVIAPNGSGGAEGTGDTGTGEGPLGALGGNLARLPLPVKLLGAVLGVGVTVYAFNKGRKAA